MDFLVWFLGGAFLVNAIPHFVNGVMGKAFQTPFADPPARGLSGSAVNVLWGAFNLSVAWVLIQHVGHFDGRRLACMLPAGTGGLAMALLLARSFGKLHGGAGGRMHG